MGAWPALRRRSTMASRQGIVAMTAGSPKRTTNPPLRLNYTIPVEDDDWTDDERAGYERDQCHDDE